jgi:shikimate dehydrogenase
MPAFRQSLLNFIKEEERPLPQHALVLGTGGASAAVQAALTELGIGYRLVSRGGTPGAATGYEYISAEFIRDVDLVVNTTPLGMQPDVDSKPDLPYNLFVSTTLAFDLVYNPVETAFMRAMLARGCSVRNGLEMLHLQAEGAWEIWTRNKEQ